MDGLSQIDQLLTSTHSKAISIINRIELISKKRFPSDNPQKLLRAVKGICEELCSLLPVLREEYKDTPPATELEIKFLARFLVELASHLRFIESATTEATPWSLIRPIEKFAEGVLPNNIFIFRPQWRYNYGILSGLIGFYRRSLEKEIEKNKVEHIFKGVEDNFYIISFPGFEKNNVLLHANFGHEIGHPIAKIYQNKEGESRSHILEIFRKVNDIVKENLVLPERLREVSRLTDAVLEIRQKGLEELICDLVGVRLLGPASLFAAEEVAHISYTFDTVGKETNYYPPWRYRIREMLTDLREQGMNEILSNIPPVLPPDEKILAAIKRKINALEEIVLQEKDLDEINKTPLTAIAYDSITETLPNVKRFLDQTLSGHVYNIKMRFSKSILPLCIRLREKIPPNAIEEKSPLSPEPIDFRDIINAGWFYKLAELSSMFEYDESKFYHEEYDMINRLTLKGIELSEVSSEYSNWKKSQNERVSKK